MNHPLLNRIVLQMPGGPIRFESFRTFFAKLKVIEVDKRANRVAYSFKLESGFERREVELRYPKNLLRTCRLQFLRELRPSEPVATEDDLYEMVMHIFRDTGNSPDSLVPFGRHCLLLGNPDAFQLFREGPCAFYNRWAAVIMRPHEVRLLLVRKGNGKIARLLGVTPERLRWMKAG